MSSCASSRRERLTQPRASLRKRVVVLDAQHEWQRRMERNPVEFLGRRSTQAGNTWTFTDGSDTTETYVAVPNTPVASLTTIKKRNGYTQIRTTRTLLPSPLLPSHLLPIREHDTILNAGHRSFQAARLLAQTSAIGGAAA